MKFDLKTAQTTLYFALSLSSIIAATSLLLMGNKFLSLTEEKLDMQLRQVDKFDNLVSLSTEATIIYLNAILASECVIDGKTFENNIEEGLNNVDEISPRLKILAERLQDRLEEDDPYLFNCGYLDN
tara:strand:+ start:75 stop:455 length:381 start_codon:yes stop_codon:yes gene_type:complete